METIRTSSKIEPIHGMHQNGTNGYVSEADYWAHYYELRGPSYEWKNGVLEEKPMATYLQASLYLWFLEILGQYVNAHSHTQLTVLDIGFRLALGPRNTAIRKPDIGVIAESNPVNLTEQERSYQGIFDLCIEVLSDSDQRQVTRDTIQKRGEYEQIGVQEYYILDDKEYRNQFLQLTPAGHYREIVPVNGVIQSVVLPGFQFRADDLYRRPPLASLAQDSVYQGYILPEFQQALQAQQWAEQLADREKQKALLAAQRALQAEQRADDEKRERLQAEQRAEQAERELARLRAELGRQTS